MTNHTISKEKIQKLMSLKGETRGISIKGDLEYILAEKGKEAVERIEKALEEMGFSLKYEEIKEMDFYPVGLEALTFLLMEDFFGFTKEEFKKMGKFNSKVSLIVRLFMKHFVSLETIAKHALEFWRKYYTVGDLNVVDVKPEENRISLEIRNFQHSPFHCATIVGYLESILKMVVGKPVECQETECVHRGGDRHLFTCKW